MRTAFRGTLSIVLFVASCGGSGSDATALPDRPDLPAISGVELETHLRELGKPAVVNVWASWCLPCRAEAPLLDAAHAAHGEEIEFIGVDVQDNQEDAKRFLAEFGLDFQHFFDPNRSVPMHFGGIGTPITFFFGPDGELMQTHNGVIDEQTLALNIDELLLIARG